MNDWTRREFLAAAALAVAQAEARQEAGGRGEPSRAAGQEPKPEPSTAAVPPSEKIVLGFIGVGGMGTGLINTFKKFPQVEIAAVCDVYEPHLRRARSAAGGTPETYGDFRRVLDRKDIDAVVIATPDHWHAIIDHPGLPGRQGRLLREAAGPPHPGRPGHGDGRPRSTSASPRWAT